MSISLELPKLTDLKPRITVFGVGGAGGNAINNMIASGLTGVDYIVANTDAQALATSSAERRVQLGVHLTEGLGAGSKPEIGEAAAEEAIEEIRTHLTGSHMAFIAAGMGGGTGTGAAAVIARAARELGVLSVGIVTKPFLFEGARRMRIAEAGIAELRKTVDTLIVIPNQNLFRVANDKTTFAEAFVLADQVLYSGVACIVDLIVKEGLINLDFADVRTVMSGMGTAMMGTGEATGDRRAVRAAEEAIANPLLDDVSLKGAKGLLLSIIGGHDMTLYEVDEAASRVRAEVDAEANIIVGATFDDSMGDRIRVAIVASGLVGQGGTASLAPGQAMAPRGAPSPHRNAPLSPTATHQEATPQRPDVTHRQPAPMQGYGGAPEPNEPQPAHARPSREVWHGPGDVRIEESLPSFSHNGPPRTQPPPLDTNGTPEPFVPRPPEDLQVGSRRMPELEEFPPVGQRDYRAKSGQYAAPPPRAPAPQPNAPRVYDERSDAMTQRRGSLLQRLTGKRGKDA